jgi:hypothetical protein
MMQSVFVLLERCTAGEFGAIATICEANVISIGSIENYLANECEETRCLRRPDRGKDSFSVKRCVRLKEQVPARSLKRNGDLAKKLQCRELRY